MGDWRRWIMPLLALLDFFLQKTKVLALTLCTLGHMQQPGPAGIFRSGNQISMARLTRNMLFVGTAMLSLMAHGQAVAPMMRPCWNGPMAILNAMTEQGSRLYWLRIKFDQQSIRTILMISSAWCPATPQASAIPRDANGPAATREMNSAGIK